MIDYAALIPLRCAPDRVEHIPVPGGYLRQIYGNNSMITTICAVRTRDGEAVGMQLYVLNEDLFTFKTERGLSGHSFNNGVVTVGTVYDDDGPADPGRKIGKREWLNECMAKMIAGLANPA